MGMMILEAATPSEQIVTALTSGFGDAVEAIISGIVAIIPIALPVFAGFVTIGLSIKLFRRLTNKG